MAVVMHTQDQEYNSLAKGRLPKAELDRPAIAVCHSFPDCWLMPQDIPGMMVPGCPCPPPEVNDLVSSLVMQEPAPAAVQEHYLGAKSRLCQLCV